MKATDAIREILERSGESARAVFRAMNRSSTYVSSAISQAERHAGMTTATVAGIAAACGYALALVPTGDVPAGAILIDPPSTGEDGLRK